MAKPAHPDHLPAGQLHAAGQNRSAELAKAVRRTLALVNSDGKTDWSAEYDAWGNVLREQNPHNLAQLIRHPGQQYDDESGLHYNRHRYYNPGLGRYITQDPIGLMGGWNFY